MPQRFLFQSTAGRRLSPFPGGAARLPTLPAVTGGYLAAYGLSRLIAGYAGPYIRVQRASDGAQADLPLDPSGGADPAAARTFAGTSNLTHGVLTPILHYDQTGAGLHASYSTGASACSLVSERDAYGAGFPDRLIVAIASQKYAFTGVTQVQKALTIPAGFTRSSQDVAAFAVMAPLISLQRNVLVGLGTGSTRSNLFTEGGSAPLGLQAFGVTGGTGAGTLVSASAGLPRTTPQVMGFVSRPSGKLVYVEDLSFSLPAEDVRTLTSGGLGLTGGGATYWLNADFYGLVVATGAPSDAEFATVRSMLSALHDTGKRANRIVLDGSSTPEGQGSINNRNYLHLGLGLLDRKVDAWNIAISGQTGTTIRDNGAARADPLFDAARRCIYVFDAISNDILAYNSGTADDAATALYAIAKAALQARKAKGFRTVPVTVTPRTDYTTLQQQIRTAYNAKLIAGQAEIGYDACFNRAAVPQAADPANSTYFQGDGIHPKDALEIEYAKAFAPVIQPLLQ